MDKIEAESAPDSRQTWMNIFRILFGDAEPVPEQGKSVVLGYPTP